MEPDFAHTLPWLDPNVKDDRIVAGVVELIREHPHCAVVIVTRDVNLQNKAAFAEIEFIEPPDPVSPTP
jgi:predicted ribonuclease YlaK